MTDYFYTVEFQQCGSPHVHYVVWMEDAPVCGVYANNDVVTYINNCITCSPHKDEDTVRLQWHKSSKTCR